MSENNDNNLETDSIYKAPTAATAVVPTDNLLEAYIGPKNASYYSQRFARIADGGGVVSWHWPAFFVTFFWMLYRKMWLWAIGYWIVLPLVLSLIQVLLINTVSRSVGFGFYWISYLIIGFVVMPMIANWLYYKHAKGKVRKVNNSTMSAEQQAVELDRIGGTSNIVFVVVPLLLLMLLGLISAIAIPAYQDYTIRAQISEGLNLAGGPKAAVAETYLQFQEFPADNAEAGLVEPSAITGKYVEAVYVIDGDIEIVYGKDAHGIIYGSAIILRPTPTDGAVEWECLSNEIMNKHLPAACRS